MTDQTEDGQPDLIFIEHTCHFVTFFLEAAYICLNKTTSGSK